MPNIRLRAKLLTGILATVRSTSIRASATNPVTPVSHQIKARGEREDFLQSILNSVAANIAVIEPNGQIIAVNEPWQYFSVQNGGAASDIGKNYLAVCKKPAPEAHDGILAVLDNRIPRFILEYPCDAPGQQRWFEMSVTPLGSMAQYGAVITHTDITERRAMHLELAGHAIRQEQEAARLAGALDRLRSLTASSELALVNERKRIAYELHDEFGQLLAALRMDIGLLKMEHSQQIPELVTRAAQMQGILSRAIASMHSIVSNLRPTVLDIGLVFALEWLKHDFTHMFRIPCVLSQNVDSIDLSEIQLTTIFRITQELLTNAAKHANAKLVQINLVVSHDVLHLSVQDNGIGFDLDAARQKKNCFGLSGMYERMLALGGESIIETAPGKGSCITLVISVERNGGFQ
ncbi:MAG: histidine kinase [Gallionella sp.]|nr:histidine kinase [Gallionella sp.]